MSLRLDRRTAESGSNSWDKREAPLMTPDPGKREKPGVRAAVRLSKHKMIHCFVDKLKLEELEKPPVGVESAMLDVFGEERCKDLVVALHPLFKRWCLYQRVYYPGRDCDLWQVVSVFCEEPEEGKIPVDFRGNKVLESFGEFIGEYKVPDKRDFEIIEPTDRKKYTLAERTEYLGRYDKDEQAKINKDWQDYEQDFAEYHNWAFTNYANQLYGSGQRMQSVPTVKVRENPEVYHIEDRLGYKVKVKRGSVAHRSMENRRREEDRIAEEIEQYRELDKSGAVYKRRTKEQIELAKQAYEEARKSGASSEEALKWSRDVAPILEKEKVPA